MAEGTVLVHYVLMDASPTARSLSDESTVAGKAWKSFIGSLAKAEGSRETYWAMQQDNPDNVGVFTCWKSLAYQQTWERENPISKLSEILKPILSQDYATFTSKRFTILTPADSSSFEAPVTKVWTWFFPFDAVTSEFEQSVPFFFRKFVKSNTTGQPGDLVGVAGGWRLEEDVFNGRKARSFTGFLGAKIVDCFRMSPPFEDNIDGRIGLGMRHFPLSEA